MTVDFTQQGGTTWFTTGRFYGCVCVPQQKSCPAARRRRRRLPETTKPCHLIACAGSCMAVLGARAGNILHNWQLAFTCAFGNMHLGSCLRLCAQLTSGKATASHSLRLAVGLCRCSQTLHYASSVSHALREAVQHRGSCWPENGRGCRQLVAAWV